LHPTSQSHHFGTPVGHVCEAKIVSYLSLEKRWPFICKPRIRPETFLNLRFEPEPGP